MTSGNFAPPGPALILLSGYPGSGKTTFAHALAGVMAIEHCESDAIRRSLFAAPSYTPAESGRVFAALEARAAVALAAGRIAVADATNLTRNDRRRFVRLAERTAAPLIAVRLTAPDSEIRRRLALARQGHSQAGLGVYEAMRGRAQPFAAATVVIDTRFPLAPAIALVVRLVQQYYQ